MPRLSRVFRVFQSLIDYSLHTHKGASKKTELKLTFMPGSLCVWIFFSLTFLDILRLAMFPKFMFYSLLLFGDITEIINLNSDP